MEILAVAGVLWRRRLLVAVGAIAALALAFAVGGAKSSSSGLASTSVLLDTPTSQLIENTPFGAETLPWRASLLAHLMASEDKKQRLADELGIGPDQLMVVDSALSSPDVGASLPKAAADAAAINEAPYALTVSPNDESLPIISLEAQAPDPVLAARLAAAAADVLKEDAPPPGDVPDVPYDVAQSEAEQLIPTYLQGFVVEDVAPVRSKPVVERPGPTKALGLAISVFGVWCACVALGPQLVRLARRRGRSRSRMQPA